MTRGELGEVGCICIESLHAKKLYQYSSAVDNWMLNPNLEGFQTENS